MLDLLPAAEATSRIVRAVPDDQLDRPTPCEGLTVGALLNHLDGLAPAFTAAATKTGDGDQAPTADASALTPDWRDRIPDRLTTLARAWRAEQAWQGTARVGGFDLTGETAGLVALGEIVVHGWDLAQATGQPYDVRTDLLAALYSLVSATAQENPEGTPGLFGPPVDVPGDAPLLHRVVALTGRDPGRLPGS